MTGQQCSRRRGLAVVVALVVLSIVALLMTFIARQVTAVRKLQDGRLAKFQAAWLARAGLETAAARLLERSEAYDGELTDIVPGGRIVIRIALEQGGPADTFRVTSEAIWDDGGVVASRAALSQLARRTQAGQITRVEWVDRP